MRMHLLKNILTPQLIATDAADPFSRIKQVRRPRNAPEPHPVWPEAVVRAVIAAAIAQQRHGVARAVALGRYAGARRGDLVRIKRSARTVLAGSNSAMNIAWLSGKKRVPVSMPEDPLLTEWLANTEPSQPLSKWQAHIQRKTGVIQMPAATIVFNTRNRAYTEDGLHQELAKIVGDLHAGGKIDGDRYNLHGLRHTFGGRGRYRWLYRRPGRGAHGPRLAPFLRNVPKAGPDRIRAGGRWRRAHRSAAREASEHGR